MPPSTRTRTIPRIKLSLADRQTPCTRIHHNPKQTLENGGAAAPDQWYGCPSIVPKTLIEVLHLAFGALAATHCELPLSSVVARVRRIFVGGGDAQDDQVGVRGALKPIQFTARNQQRFVLGQ